MAKRLFIIQPSHYRTRSSLTIHQTRKRILVPLTLPYLAALTPKEWNVDLIDEQMRNVEFQAPVDLVAITTWTINSFRAYEIADRFRERGVPVIMGGPHTYFYAEEAAQHCDAVGIGEGENIWPMMLKDAAKGRLEKVVSCRPPFFSPRPSTSPVTISWIFGGTVGLRLFRFKPPGDVPLNVNFAQSVFISAKAIVTARSRRWLKRSRRSKARNLLFADSNFAGKMEHTMELMEALIPLKVRWSTLWSAYLCTNQKFMDLAQRSGLLHLNIGIESIDPDALDEMNKKVNKVHQYKEILRNLQKRGISYSLNFIFGLDTEKKEAFPLDPGLLATI